MRTANYTDFRSNLKSYMDSVIDNSDTVVVNRGGGTGVVLISLDEYNSLIETEYIMSSPEMVRRINMAKQEIKEGKCITQKDGESTLDFLDRIACPRQRKNQCFSIGFKCRM